MFQKVKQMCRKAKGFIQGVSTKVKMLALTLFSGTTAMAQSTAGDYSAGTTALSTVAEEIVKYVPVMVKLCYAIACVILSSSLLGFLLPLGWLWQSVILVARLSTASRRTTLISTWVAA